MCCHPHPLAIPVPKTVLALVPDVPYARNIIQYHVLFVIMLVDYGVETQTIQIFHHVHA
jgi:hypothetical protein